MAPYIVGFDGNEAIQDCTGGSKGRRAHCAVPGCGAPGEFKAPLQPANFDGPGAWRFLCLDHVREHNAKYNFFEGMSPEEITRRAVAARRLGAAEPQVRRQRRRPAAEVERLRRSARRDRGALRRHPRARQPSRFSKAERRALSVLGLGEDADRHALRQRYSNLVRRYHPDKNGGDRRHESKLGAVIEAYQLLRKSAAFA